MEESCDVLSRRVPNFAKGKRILLVDRDASSLTHIASLLESYSYKVTSIELESVAMSTFSEHKNEFDAVMVDMNMKDMTSLEFVRGILLTKNYTPIILMSSKGDETIVSQALTSGVCHFLEKPIPKDQLVQIWQHVYRVRKLSKEEGMARGSRTSVSEGSMMKENGNGYKRSADIEISDLGDDNTRIDFEGIDPKGKKKQVEEEVDLLALGMLDSKLPIGLTMDGIDELRLEANERCNRKRPNTIDDGGTRKYQKNYFSERSQSRGQNPSGDTYEIRELGLERGNQRAIQDMVNNPLLSQHNTPTHMQRNQVQSMSNSRDDATTSLLSSGNLSAFNISSGTGASQSQELQGSVRLIEPRSSLQLRLGDGRNPGPGSTQNFLTQYGCQNSIRLSSLSHGRDLVPEFIPFAYVANTNVPTGLAMLPLAQATRSSNLEPGSGRVSLGQGEVEYLSQRLRNPLNEDIINPHAQTFDRSHL